MRLVGAIQYCLCIESGCPGDTGVYQAPQVPWCLATEQQALPQSAREPSMAIKRCSGDGLGSKLTTVEHASRGERGTCVVAIAGHYQMQSEPDTSSTSTIIGHVRKVQSMPCSDAPVPPGQVAPPSTGATIWSGQSASISLRVASRAHAMLFADEFPCICKSSPDITYRLKWLLHCTQSPNCELAPSLAKVPRKQEQVSVRL